MTSSKESNRWCRLIMPLTPLLLVSAVACSDATAMGKAQNSSGSGAAGGGLPALNTANGNALSAGSYQDGLILGHRNGEIIVGRLRAGTIGVRGCSALPKLEQALIKVVQNITAPQGGDQLVRGFFKGYLDSVRDAIHQTRWTCQASTFDNGEWAGIFYGTLLCKLSVISIDMAQSLEMEPLYEGWSGSSSDVKHECRTAANVTLKSCKLSSGSPLLPIESEENETIDLSQILNVAVQTSCSDN